MLGCEIQFIERRLLFIAKNKFLGRLFFWQPIKKRNEKKIGKLSIDKIKKKLYEEKKILF